MKTVANRIDLGMTRIAGYNLYDEVSLEFQETTPKEVKDLINCGQVNGLKLINGEIQLDKEDFNMCNLMVKSAVGKFRPLYPDDSIVTCMYAVVRMIETDNGRLYEIISNKCSRVKITYERLKLLMEVGYVAGVKNINGAIEICKGVPIEDRRTKNEKASNSFLGEAADTKQSLIDNKEAKSKNTEISTISETDTKEQKSMNEVFDNMDVNTANDVAAKTSDDSKESIIDNTFPIPVEEKKTAVNHKTKKK